MEDLLDVNNYLEENFGGAIKSVKNNKAKFDSFNKTLKQASREINRGTQLVSGAADTFSDFATSINQIINSSAVLVQAPSTLANNLRTAFDNLSVAYSNSQDLFDVAKGLFGFNQRTLLGSRVNYRHSKDFNIGATWMNMIEKPITQKVNFGDEPFSNHIVGFDVNSNVFSRVQLRITKKLLYLSTKYSLTMDFQDQPA